jgi:hypothetical protein
MTGLIKWTWTHRRICRSLYPIECESKSLRSELRELAGGQEVVVSSTASIIGAPDRFWGYPAIKVRVRRQRVGVVPRRIISTFERRNLAMRCWVVPTESGSTFQQSVDIRRKTVPMICISLALSLFVLGIGGILITGAVHFDGPSIEGVAIPAGIMIVMVLNGFEDLKGAMRDEATLDGWREGLLDQANPPSMRRSTNVT